MRTNDVRPSSHTWPRRAVVALLSVLILLLAGVLAASVWWILSSDTDDDGVIPTVSSDRIARDITVALDRHFEEEGFYPATIGDVLVGAGLEPLDGAVFLYTASPDLSEFIAGAFRYADSAYIAVFSGSDRVGESDTYERALARAGWTPEWAAEAGFSDLPEQVREYGALDVVGGAVRRVTIDMSDVTARGDTLSPAAAAAGASWRDAVTRAAEAAGATVDIDEAAAVVDQAAWSNGPVRVELTDGVKIAVARFEPGEYGARVTPAPANVVDGLSVSDVLDDPAYADLRGTDRVYSCATATGEHGIEQVTLCLNLDGTFVAWATTGRAAEAADAPTALSEAGVDEDWASRVGVAIPAAEDLV